MFYYISFLRPPPSNAGLSGKLSITPQITNDLRTEFYPKPQDIFYAWSSPLGTQTRSSKLTTWRQENAYKEIVVPLPPLVREGQQWTLNLTASSKASDVIVNLQDSNTLGRVPFGVLSMPIQFGRSTATEKKQGRIERVYALHHGTMKITEQTSFDLDKKIWDSGIGLSSWLVTKSRSGELPEVLRSTLFSEERRDIIELGAGTGVLSLTVAALRSSVNQRDDSKSRIITTDLESAIPLLEHNIASNGHLFSDDSARPKASVLDWYEDLPDDIQSFNDGFDAIIAKRPLILLGYKERDEAERTIWDMANEIGVRFRKVDMITGSGVYPVEVWIGEMEWTA
ncbi:putative methyltransferase-domain-containing protein [Armillaria luteobubalina]|uniref:Methyltransferase-domain-containing protein n=1 Tax=Armillaria luteobubalina TaxID=153913 RepID=A0AA39UPR5_9AGAR|nr:putative methyltransferase-domain-containing protein [Armillaria luteobubalina]